MKEIPPKFRARIEKAKQQGLKELDLSNDYQTDDIDKLKEIPPEVFELEQLESLNLSWNKITTIPQDLARLQNLQSLDLWQNRLSEFPRVLGQLPNLVVLRLQLSSLTSLPGWLSQIKDLSLDLSGNKITNLPKSMAKLSNLTWLDLRGNQITNLPESITKLSNLTRLDLRENQITNLPESIAKLSNLTWLSLRKNQITNLPESMAKLSNLTWLSLRKNQITNLPESMAKLSNLTQLFLRENQITNLPESMAKLSNLTLLDLRKNQITNLPESMAKLSNLTLLNLRGNQITNLPESMAKLSNLTQLNLSENKITNLPESMAKLSNLTGLDLRGNQITNLPESMAKLSNLTQLNLSKNQITNLPESICQLSNLRNLDLRENPLVTPPLEVARKGIEAIREYFEQLKPDSDYLYEAKLLIVGEGGAGKTTLAEVIEYYGKREIKIRVVGKHKRDLLIAVTHELDKTDDTMDLRRFDKSHRKQLIEDEREATERENEFLREIVKLQASKGINVRTETLMYDQRGAKFGGGFAGRDYKGDITYNYAQQGNLAEAAAEIQQLLEQLSQTNPTTTSKEKMIVVAEAVDTIESNPTLKGRVINALKAEGTEAFKEAIDHPLVNILMATIEGWQEV